MKEAFLEEVAPESRAEGWTGVSKAKSGGRALQRGGHANKVSEVRVCQRARGLGYEGDPVIEERRAGGVGMWGPAHKRSCFSRTLQAGRCEGVPGE